ncbi:MAG: hypothetical protein ABGW82_05970, partial [Paracoccus sp. (in: a-proteobacteria)]
MMASANLNVMIKAARKAGRALVKDFREVENLQVSVKGAGDFVTRADREEDRAGPVEALVDPPRPVGVAAIEQPFGEDRVAHAL